MKTADYVIACRTNEIVQAPTKIEQVEDLGMLYNGLSTAMEYAYDYILKFPKSKSKSMTELRNACDTINFATAQLASTKIAYNDLVNKIVDHNEQIINSKEN